MLHVGILLTLALLESLVMQASGRYLPLLCRLHYHFAKKMRIIRSQE